jgi:hypothetical protein
VTEDVFKVQVAQDELVGRRLVELEWWRSPGVTLGRVVV